MRSPRIVAGPNAMYLALDAWLPWLDEHRLVSVMIHRYNFGHYAWTDIQTTECAMARPFPLAEIAYTLAEVSDQNLFACLADLTRHTRPNAPLHVQDVLAVGVNLWVWKEQDRLWPKD